MLEKQISHVQYVCSASQFQWMDWMYRRHLELSQQEQHWWTDQQQQHLSPIKCEDMVTPVWEFCCVTIACRGEICIKVLQCWLYPNSGSEPTIAEEEEYSNYSYTHDFPAIVCQNVCCTISPLGRQIWIMEPCMVAPKDKCIQQWKPTH